MHTVKESGTFTNKDGTKSTQLTEGDQISDEDAVDLGLMSEKDAAAETKDAGRAPENKAKQ